MTTLYALSLLSSLAIAETSTSETEAAPSIAQVESQQDSHSVMISTINLINQIGKFSAHFGTHEKFSVGPVLIVGKKEDHTILAGGLSARWYFYGNNANGFFTHIEALASQDESERRTDQALEADLLVGGKVILWDVVAIDGGLGAGYIYFPNHPNLISPRIQFDIGYGF